MRAAPDPPRRAAASLSEPATTSAATGSPSGGWQDAFAGFYGNRATVEALQAMIAGDRIAQTILLSGPRGVGKATLARCFATALLGHAELIAQDDLSLEHNVQLLAEREKLPSEKRAEEPLLLGTHTDFLTFPPEGPLRQISIQQVRLLKERALYKPLRGRWRVFLVDEVDRANEQAANSLLKVLEEPPEHLIIFLTATNHYDLLPTIRSRSVIFPMTRLDENDMRQFAAARRLPDAARRIALARGAPGIAATIDLESYDRQRESMLALLATACGAASFGHWVKHSEALSRQEKLERHLSVLYMLLEDLLHLQQIAAEVALYNADIPDRLRPLAARCRFDWLREAVALTDELRSLLRRNVQKTIALDHLVLQLRRKAAA